MFKRLSFVAIFLTLTLFLTMANFNLTFKKYSSNQTLYKGSKSSLSEQISLKNAGFLDCLSITGQSCTVYENLNLEDLIEDFSAYVVYEERVLDITNYYCYSPKIKYGINVKGKTVNLHIALKNGKTVLGTPIIFGSY